MYVEPIEEHRRVEMLLMIVYQTERTSLESHCLVDGPQPYKRKVGTPTQNKDRFLKRTQQEGKAIAHYAADLRNTLYQAWPSLPRDQLDH